MVKDLYSQTLQISIAIRKLKRLIMMHLKSHREIALKTD